MQTNCNHCGQSYEIRTGDYNRAQVTGAPLYCNRVCMGLARRLNKSTEQKKLHKKAYDEQYRKDKAAKIKADKAAYHKATYDPTKAAIVRKKRAPYHAEYCRQPEYKEYKREYDKHNRAKKFYGEFGEAAIILFELEEILDNRAIKLEQGLTNKTQKRKRQWQTIQKLSQQTI